MPVEKGMNFPTLYRKSKTGAIWEWTVWTEGPWIVTRYGVKDGAMQIARRKAEPTNIGRSNERTENKQAEFEAKSDWTYRVERKYSETVADAEEEVFLPMLAKTFKDEKKPRSKWGRGIKYPADVQPKLDGVRCMAFWDSGNIYLGTRNGKEWAAPRHIAHELEGYLPNNMVLDGELYIHGALFEDLSSWTKKIYPETGKLEYHIFDMSLDEFGRNLPWYQRRDNLVMFFQEYAGQMKMLRLVPTIRDVRDVDQVLTIEEKFIEDGYEGCMTRNLGAKYEFGHRSTDLQKVKSSTDAEFRVVGFKEGIGKDSGCIVWVCETDKKLPFDCRPKATLDRRAKLYQDALRNFDKKYKGELLKVVFQNYTENGKPRFPRSVGFRDKRDL